MIIKVNLSELIFDLFIIIGMFFFSNINSSIGEIWMLGILGIWIINRILKRKYFLYELLMFMVVGLYVGANYLLYFGIIINLLYICINIKRGWNKNLDWEILGFAIMLISGIFASFINAIDKNSANQYIIVYMLLFLFLCENKMVYNNIIVDENKVIRFFSLSSFIFGIGFFITHTVSELFSLSRMTIFYNLKEGVRSNTLAGIMAPFVFASMLIAIEAKDKKSKILSALAIVTMLPVILAIQSRGAYLGILIAVIWILFRGKSPKIIIFSVGLLIILSIVYVNIPSVFERFFGRFSSVIYRTGSSLNGRGKLYHIAWEMFKEHPIIGNGFWQFNLYGIQERDPHNFLLAYLASTGIIGGVGFLIYLVAIYKRFIITLKLRMNHSKLLCEIGITSYIIFVVHGCVEPSLSTQAPLAIFILLTLLPNKTSDTVS